MVFDEVLTQNSLGGRLILAYGSS